MRQRIGSRVSWGSSKSLGARRGEPTLPPLPSLMVIPLGVHGGRETSALERRDSVCQPHRSRGADPAALTEGAD
jgi:hypothetical protein